ncbi:MAG: hypothetical protein DDT26_00660 [Dehalococcoidia bacterium]|nr:hypothetical protein [Chloroflexota bacterium]
MNLLTFKIDAIDEFSYGIEHKPKGGTKRYDINQLVVSLSMIESLFNKSISSRLSISDGAGYFERIGFTVGDEVTIAIEKGNIGPSARRIETTFVVAGITGEAMRSNAKERVYLVECVTAPAFENAKRRVSRSLRGTVAECIAALYQQELGIEIPRENIEPTFGAVDYIAPFITPFEVADELTRKTLSTDQTRIDNLFLLYEQIGDGVKFKSVRTIASEAKTHDYQLFPSSTYQASETDFFRILAMKRVSQATLDEFIKSGILRSSAYIVDPIARTMTAEVFDYATDYQKLLILGTTSPVDIDSVQDIVVSSPVGDSTHTVATVSEEAYNRVETYGRRYAATNAQRELLSSTQLNVTIHGNPDLRAGDIINLVTPILYQADESQDQFDLRFTGKFIVGSVKHEIQQADSMTTRLDLYKDGYEIDIHQTRKATAA